jgi:hypothetical protein
MNADITNSSHTTSATTPPVRDHNAVEPRSPTQDVPRCGPKGLSGWLARALG